MFVNKMPRYEILSQDAIATLDTGWRRLMTEIGVEFMSDRALDLFRQAGQRVAGQHGLPRPRLRTRAGRQGARASSTCRRATRELDPHRRRPHGFGAVYGPPFVREGDVRRDATMDDYRNFAKLAQSFGARLRGWRGLRAQRRATGLAPPRHDLRAADADRQDLSWATSSAGSTPATRSRCRRSCSAAARRIEAGRARIEETPATISLINCNSPLRWDDRMLEAQFEYCAANQPVVLTPFILMGAMSPVTIPAALVQQITEALSGIALSQLIRPGLPGGLRLFPVQHRHAVGLAHLRHAGVGHRSAVHRADRPPLRVAVPYRRRPHLVTGPGRPSRLRGADDLDADLPGRHQLGHALRRLARGRAGRRIREVRRRRQIVEMLQHEFTPLEIDEASLAFGAHEEVGHGGHFLGSMHTMERFRTCFYRPFLNSSENYERWMRGGQCRHRGPSGQAVEAARRGVRAAAAGRGDP
jgi:trimethylamine--corrinoid protein Co-methyltransferase